MKYLNGIWGIILALLLSACAKENMGDCFKSTGKDRTEKRMLQSFTAIEIDDEINVFLEQSSENSAEVSGGENLLEFIRTEVKNGILYIENDNRCNWVRSFKKDINVIIRASNLEQITYYGSGDVKCLGTLTPNKFLLNAWNASGDIELDINCNDVELKLHTGPISLKCKGSGDRFIAYNSSIGKLDTRKFVASDVLAVNANSGDLKVFSDSLLDANIEGNGDLYYSGNPIVKLRVVGSGSLIKLD
ncbi:MAG: hypothetical protein CMP59_07645 [Flavobacteriales bacterium]|nr:hypothetical protein [Flavobacteriales bacterium]